jgi:hypothetical protein
MVRLFRPFASYAYPRAVEAVPAFRISPLMRRVVPVLLKSNLRLVP